MASRHRRTARATAATTVGVCLAALATTHTSLAFHLHTAPRGIVAVDGGCDHARTAARRSATCRLTMLRRRSEPSEEEEAAAAAAADNGQDRREVGAAKELSALLLSAMLLGNPQLSDAATVTSAGLDPTVQGRLIADLEKRLLSLPDSDATAPDTAAAAPPASSPAATADTTQQIAAAAATDAPRIQPMFVPPSSQTPSTAPSAAEESPPAAAAAAAAAPEAAAPARASAPQKITEKAPDVGGRKKEPLIKMKDYSFSIRLPELNLPPVEPITVPEEGSPITFRAPSRERVAAQDFPGAGAVREALQGVARGEGVKELTDAIAAAQPKQADFYR